MNDMYNVWVQCLCARLQVTQNRENQTCVLGEHGVMGSPNICVVFIKMLSKFKGYV